MDYASRLGAMLPQPGQMPQPQGGGFRLSAANANVTPEQQSILDVMMGIFNNPSMLANAKTRGPK